MRAALYGAGGWGVHVLEAVERSELVDLVGVVEPNEERWPHLATLTEARFGTDGESVPDHDAAFVCTPVATHQPVAVACLNAGKDVWVEKPLAWTTFEAQAIADAARLNRRRVFVDHLMLYAPGVRELYRLIRSGELGDVHSMHFERTNMGTVRTEEDALWSLAPHDVSIALALIDEELVECQAMAVKNDGQLADTVFGKMQFALATATFRVSWLDPWKRRSVTVVGSKAAASYDDRGPDVLYRWEIDWKHGQPSLTDVSMQAVAGPKPLDRAVEVFARGIAQGSSWPSGLDQGVKVVKVLEVLERSMSNGGVAQWIADR
jgi:predicted dehydrogenase